MYKSFSLNGSWEMNYREEKYTDQVNPWQGGVVIENAVPGYWEDMTAVFKEAPFAEKLVITPEYQDLAYPMTGLVLDMVPDMVLPNVVGNFFYHRTFVYEKSQGQEVIYFSGVQNAVSVWINDVFLGRHEGYSTPFSMEIPKDALKDGENHIVLSVSNHLLAGYDGRGVSGLTNRAANEATGGVTGDVEIRSYQTPIRGAAVLTSKDGKTASVVIEATEPCTFDWEVFDGETVLKKGKAEGDFDFSTEGLEKWFPENPKLYGLRIFKDGYQLEQIFGVRRLNADEVRLYLNDVTYYLRGICEHCYFPETIHPNHDKKYYGEIISKVKELGFNFIRFHTYIPEEEYMQAADELGILVHVESPNNTTLEEWKQIVAFCRKHPSVVIYCCGNELRLDEAFIDFHEELADVVHQETDALFSPQSALPGLEYAFRPEDQPFVENALEGTEFLPFAHHPGRFEKIRKFSDVFNSYSVAMNSYSYHKGNPKRLDAFQPIYQRPRLCHEICIDGTFTDLRLKERYQGLRVGETKMFTSLEEHLKEKVVLEKANLYFENSCQWQRRLRKYCFEHTRMSRNLAGYDFLGPIDTHWHTFGYDVGMMNEFYELKPGETVENVLRYNSASVLLTDLAKKTNFTAGEDLAFSLYLSHYCGKDIANAEISVELKMAKETVKENFSVSDIKNGDISKLIDFSYRLPIVEKPEEMLLRVTLQAEDVSAENQWELYLFPKIEEFSAEGIVVGENLTAEELKEQLKAGKTVVIFGKTPFVTKPTSFRISLAGRTEGNLATVIHDHSLTRALPHQGFCGWQFVNLMEDGEAVCFDDDAPFSPIIEVVSTHKRFIRQAALFEYKAFEGKLLVCSFKFDEADPAGRWLKAEMLSYAQSGAFAPKEELTEEEWEKLLSVETVEVVGNQNLASNPNDKAARKKVK